MMNKGVVAFLAFTFGGVAGFVAGKKLLEQHYAQLVEEEVESVKRAFHRQVQEEVDSAKQEFRNRIAQGDAPKNEEAVADNKPVADVKPAEKPRKEIKDYRAYYPESKATEKKEEPKEEPKEEKSTKPYVISPQEFDTIRGYEAISLTLYADHVVADDDDNAMSEEDVEETITRESLNHFGEYENDSVYVRNDDMRTDYEILLDERRYADVMKTKPYLNPTK